MWASLQSCLKIFLLFLSSHLYGTMMHRVIARLLYLPTVLRLLLLRGPNSKWYSRVDDTVILGALPLRNQTKELVEEQNVRAVLSFNQSYELILFTNSHKDWAKHGVRQFVFPTWDFQPPKIQYIEEGLSVIDEEKQKKNCVYVHCKAGKGRSAVMATCYVMKRYKLTPVDAIDFLERKRPQIRMNIHQRKVILEFHERLQKSD